MSPEPPETPAPGYISPLTGEWEPLLSHPIEKKAHHSYLSLTEPERAWYTITRLIFCIRDGGLISYYYNGYAEHVRDVLTGLDAIGATQAKSLVLDMNGLFGGEVPRTLEGLNSAISAWPDTPEIRRIVERDNDIEQAAADDAEERLNAYCSTNGLPGDA